MTTEEQMLRLAAVIGNEPRVNADGYTYCTRYTCQLGYTYAAPIGSLSATDAALEAALLGMDKEPVIDPSEVAAGGGSSQSAEQKKDEPTRVVAAFFTSDRERPSWWLALLAWFKAKPYRYGLIALLVAAIGYVAYKKKG